MSHDADTPGKLRHISARIPEALARQIEIVQERHRLRHFAEAVALVVDRGLSALARARVEEDQIEATILRIEDMMVTQLALLNVGLEVDDEAVAETRAAILEEWKRRGRRPGGTP
ncbi:hypothetical protein GAY33_03100 [Azospirillum brasilense]|uniref:Uncharacterized protein n=1 Tax=Azospirillum brasilense TaxID=192 RepID=A0A4D8QCP5_AZOBR|nr:MULTISPECIES: hypothetical protein [Azospirillum]MBF5093754.1 hypothetical protein [Azospirillum sp. INR13]MBK3798237.1 hypothetical protein [Azospirillum argentinense]QCO05890.1 hypothetical protein D3867_28915 [Azospirillum argentinense]